MADYKINSLTLTSHTGDNYTIESEPVYKSLENVSVATLDKAAKDAPIISLTTKIEPQQDLHGYDNPWPAGAVNLIPDGTDTSEGYYNGAYINNDGSYGSYLANWYISEYFEVESNTQYMMSFDRPTTPNDPSVCFYDSNKVFISGVNFGGTSPKSITTPANAVYARCSQYKTDGYLVQFEKGTTATDIRPYSNICPITGFTEAKVTRTRKNLLSRNWLSGGLSISTGEFNAYSQYWVYNPDYIYVGLGDVTFSSKENSRSVVYEYDREKNFIRARQIADGYKQTFIPCSTDGAYFVRIAYNVSGATEIITPTSVLLKEPQLEFGSTATAYEPFGTVYPISLPSQAGTVYGGQLTIHKDGSGELVVDRKGVDLGNQSWDKNPTTHIFHTTFSDGASVKSGGYADAICSNYSIYTGNTVAIPNGCFVFSNSTNSSVSGRLLIMDSVYSENSSATEFKTAMSGVQFVYPLATPITYTLTAPQVKTLLGENHVWSDTGDIQELTYYLDTPLAYDLIDDIGDEAGNGIVGKTWSADKLSKIGDEFEKTIEGPVSIVDIDDGAEDVPLKSIKMEIEPQQDLHGYSNPWPAGGGINLLDTRTQRLPEFSIDSDGWMSGSDTSVDSRTWTYANSQFQMTLPAGTYNLCFENSGTKSSSCGLTIKDTTDEPVIDLSASYKNNTSGYGQFTLSEEKSIGVIAKIFASKVRLMIAKSTDSTTWQPYSNICPITGFTGAELMRTGKNIFDKNSSNILNGYIDGSTHTFVSDNYHRSYYVKCKQNTTYTISKIATTTNGRFGVALCDVVPSNGVSLYQDSTKGSFTVGERTTYTVTTTESTKYIVVWAYRVNYDANSVDSIQIEYGSSATVYELFGQVYPITFPTSAGTVYGGTVTVNKDGSGTLVVERGIIEYDGSSDEDWTAVDSNRRVRLMTPIPSNMKDVSSTIVSPVLSNMFPAVSSNDTYLGHFGISNHHDRFEIADGSGSMDATAFKNMLALNPLVIVYEFATPITYKLTAPQIKTLLKENHIWSDTGDILSLTYSVDKKIVYDIDHAEKRIDAVKSSLVPQEGIRATENHSIGEIFMIGETLYQATQTIARDDVIDPLTNVEAITLKDYIDEKAESEAAAMIDDEAEITEDEKVYSVSKTEERLSDKADVITRTIENAQVATFTDGADDMPVKELTVAIEPKQDLHGYDHPWAPGAGKNLLPMTIKNLKAWNTYGTWNGNVYSHRNVTFDVQTDDGDNVTGIKVNGTPNATGTTMFNLASTDAITGTFIITGCPSGGSNAGYCIRCGKGETQDSSTYLGIDEGSGLNVSLNNEKFHARINVEYGTTMDNKVYYPMLRLSTVSDATFAPYSNICPIEGFTGANVTGTGKNIFNQNGMGEGYIAGRFLNQNGEEAIPGSKESWVISEYTKVKPSTTYSALGFYGIAGYIWEYDEDKRLIPNTGHGPYAGEDVVLTFTTNAKAKYIRATIYIYQNTYYRDKIIVEGSTVSSYEPFGTTHQITFPSSVGTVYGGNLTLHKDGSADLVVDWCKETISNIRNNDESSFGIRYGVIWTQNRIYYDDSQAVVILEKAKGVSYNERGQTPYVGFRNDNLTILIRAGSNETAEEWTSMYVGSSVAYKLATPIIYTLTAPQVKTLLGNNNIWADTGKINSLTYYTDNRVNDELDDLVKDDGNSFIGTVTSTVDLITLDDAASVPVKGMKIDITPVQDLHGQESPYPAGAGKNLFDNDSEYVNNSYIDSTGAVVSDNSYRYFSEYFPVQANTTYTFQFNKLQTNSRGVSIAEYNNSKQFIQTDEMVNGGSNIGVFFTTFTTTATTAFVRVSKISKSTYSEKIQIEIGLFATSYAPYSNICPITGWSAAKVVRTGKNLFDKNSVTNNYYIALDGTITAAGGFAYSDLIPVKAGETYTYSYNQGDANPYTSRLHGYNGDGNWVQHLGYQQNDTKGTYSITVTIPIGISYVRISYHPGAFGSVQFRRGSYVTAYEAYSGNKEITIPFSSTYYGGTLTYNEDGSVTVVVDEQKYGLLGLTFTQANSGNGRFVLNVTQNGQPKSAGQNTPICCSHFKWIDESGIDTTSPWVYFSSNEYLVIQTGDASIDTVDKFNTWLSNQNNGGNPVEVCYKVATASQTAITLTTPELMTLLKGYNTLYADCGDITELTYFKDKKISYELDELKSALRSLLSAAGVSF